MVYSWDVLTYDALGNATFLNYSLVEIVAAICGCISIWSIRESVPDQIPHVIKVLVTICTVVDGLGAGFNIYLWICVFLDYPFAAVISPSIIYWKFCLAAFNLAFSGLLVNVLMKSSVSAKSMMPLVLDLIVGLGEVMFLLFTKDFERFIHSMAGDKLSKVYTGSNFIPTLSRRNERKSIDSESESANDNETKSLEDAQESLDEDEKQSLDNDP